MPTVARPLSFTPRRTAHLLHLLLSLSTSSYLVTLLLFLLSPYDLPLLVLRAALQLQLTNPRRTHPSRSLRLFLGVLWVPTTVGAVLWHSMRGSRGTKGEKGWYQGGIVVDFIGQAVTPSKTHLILLDLLLALLQLATLLVAFGATVPSDLDASAAGEGEEGRDYGGLLGEEEEESFDEEDEEVGLRKRRLRMGGYEEVEDELEEEEEENEGDEVRSAYSGSSKTSFSPFPSSSSSPSTLPPSHIRLAPVADIRLRTVWREVRRSAADSWREVEVRAVRDREEGREA
ncbi:hypothetical protein JCM8547_006774 [Rhodosporidiobolus lusitaniae]